MDAALGPNPSMIERQVHQHRLAASDPAPEVDAALLAWLAAKHAAQQPRPAAGKLPRQPVERLDRALLLGIGPQFPRCYQRGVGRADRARHSLAGVLARFTRLSVPVKL